MRKPLRLSRIDLRIFTDCTEGWMYSYVTSCVCRMFRSCRCFFWLRSILKFKIVSKIKYLYYDE